MNDYIFAVIGVIAVFGIAIIVTRATFKNSILFTSQMLNVIPAMVKAHCIPKMVHPAAPPMVRSTGV